MEKELVYTEKPWYLSKTLWINFGAVALGVAGILLGQVEAGVTITIAGVANAVLRIISREGIEF
jgi:hypothetical protein